VNPSQGDVGDLYSRLEPWIVLAAGTLITACYTRNFSSIQLLKSPIRYGGTISGGVAMIDLPSWFPVQEAVLDAAGGTIYAKVKELALPTNTQKVGDQAVRVQIDLRQVPLPAGDQAFSLTYFPWFRFLSEPIGFDVVGRVAEYVGGCFRFMFAQNGIPATIGGQGDHRAVNSDAGSIIDVIGMRSLSSITLSDGAKRSSIDLEAKEIDIDRAMFPAAYEAGQRMLGTPDRLVNVDARLTETHLHLSEAKGAANV